MLSTLFVFAPLFIGLVTYGLAVRRILVSRSTAGTSATSLVVSAVSCIGWTTWAAWQGFGALALVNAIWIPLLIAPELIAMARVKPLRWGSWPLIPVWTAVMVLTGVVSLSGGPDLLGLTISASGLLWLAPALGEILRREDLTGVSLSSWLISGVSTALWGAYGLINSAWVPTAYSAIQMLGISVAVVRILLFHLRAQRERRV